MTRQEEKKKRDGERKGVRTLFTKSTELSTRGECEISLGALRLHRLFWSNLGASMKAFNL